MIAQIKELRSIIEVSISEAKEVLWLCNGEVQAAYTLAMNRRIDPIVDSLGLDRTTVAEAFLENGQDCEKTIKHLRYLADPDAFEQAHSRKVSELVDAIEQGKDDVYAILEACETYFSPSIEVLLTYPEVIQHIVCIGVFYSHYLTDTDALLAYYPAEYHEKIEGALHSIGTSSIANRYRQDVIAVKQSNENFSAFLAEEEVFICNLRAFCLTHVDELFSWQMERSKEGEEAANA